MRFRSILVLVVSAVLLSAVGAYAQKRLSTTVNPNKDAFSDTIEIYNPKTGKITRVDEKLSAGRERPAVFQLASGRVLVGGGVNNRYLNIAELYNPADGSVTEIAEDKRMIAARNGMSYIMAPGGVALIFGGYNSNYIASIEQYDNVSEKFVSAGQMTVPRQFAATTLLGDKTILITGGYNGSNYFLDAAEIYDPSKKSSVITDQDMTEARAGHTAVLISSKKVLLAGGCNNSKGDEMVCDVFLDTAEIYDATDSDDIVFTATTGKMTTARKDHTATVLPDGRVLIVGGTNGVSALDTAEIYDPATDRFTATGKMTTSRTNHTATLVNGLVVIAGGESASGEILNSVEIYDPAAGTFSLVSDRMTDARTLHSAVVINEADGDKVLFIAGLSKPKLVFDINYQVLGDSIGGDIYLYTPLGSEVTGFTAYTGSGTILAFSAEEEGGGNLQRIETGGWPVNITPIFEDPVLANYPQYLAVVSAMDNRIFIIDPAAKTLYRTYSFDNAVFGFGSRIELSPDGRTGYISSSGTGAVIKFNVETGAETGRLSGFRTPAQITGTKDGKTLMIVDAGTNVVKAVDAATMTVKNTFNPWERFYAVQFSIHNRVVFNDDETLALITSQDTVLGENSTALLFNPATGEWILYKEDPNNDDEDEKTGISVVGYKPGWTLLRPDGKRWLILSQNNISLVSTTDPRTVDWSDDDAVEEYQTKNYRLPGAPMESTNVALSPDGRYAFIASATTDQVFQMDTQTGGFIGAYPLGDDPNISPDQPITVALTPDGGILAVTSFISNEVNLFVDSYMYRQTRYISQQDRFTGISIVNVSPDDDAIVKITARTDSGNVLSYGTGIGDDEIPNPKTLILEPNAQISIDISELLELDNDAGNNSGYLTIDSNLPVIVGYTAVGQIQSSFLSTYIRSMESVEFFTFENVPFDMILPEIPENDDAISEVNLLNPWYSTATYTVSHYGPDGTERSIWEDVELSAQTRQTNSISNVVTTTQKSQVLLIGGMAKSKTVGTAEVYNGRSLSYGSSVGMRTPRHGLAAALLPSGNVLISGGRNGYIVQKTAELYNPSSGASTFTPGSMNVERYRHTATRLSNGLVLLAGGQNTDSITRTAEIYDYSKGSFSYAKDASGERSEMAFPRDAHTATLLTDNRRVLIVGGLDGTGTSNTAEIYDTETGKFTLVESRMKDARAFHTATLLNNGQVLIVGGYNGEYLKSAEIFNTVTNRFEAVSDMTEARSNHAATLLSDGSVLITGGRNSVSDADETGGLDTAELYDPLYGVFNETGNVMMTPRSYHTAINFRDDDDGDNDRVIISGGYGEIGTDDEPELGALSRSEVYTPGTRMFTAASSSLSGARYGHTAIMLDEEMYSGHLRFTSDRGILASERYNLEEGGAPASLSAINMAKYKGVTEIYSPRFVFNDNRTTILNVINGNEEAADITLALYTDSGVEIAARTRNLAANAQIKGTLDEVFNNSTVANTYGWIKVSSTKDQVVGTVTFRNPTDKNKYMASFELTAPPPPESASYCYIFPLVSENSDFDTELSFLNSGAEAASVSLQLWEVVKPPNTATQIAGEKQINLAPGTNKYGTLRNLFEKTKDYVMDYGNVRVTSDKPILSMGEIQAKSGRFITPVPAVSYKCSE